MDAWEAYHQLQQLPGGASPVISEEKQKGQQKGQPAGQPQPQMHVDLPWTVSWVKTRSYFDLSVKNKQALEFIDAEIELATAATAEALAALNEMKLDEQNNKNSKAQQTKVTATDVESSEDGSTIKVAKNSK